MTGYKGPERRRHRRKTELIGVNIKGINHKKIQPKLNQEIGLNISEGGVLLECSKRLAKGSHLKLKVMLILDSKHKIIKAPSIVVWNKKSRQNTYYLGCKFTRLEHNDRTLLRKFTSIR